MIVASVTERLGTDFKRDSFLKFEKSAGKGTQTMNDKSKENTAATATATTATITPQKFSAPPATGQNLNPIVDTFWHCEDYNKVSQECYCVREALKKKNDGG